MMPAERRNIPFTAISLNSLADSKPDPGPQCRRAAIQDPTSRPAGGRTRAIATLPLSSAPLPRRLATLALSIAAVLALLAAAPARAEKVHFTYLWHMEQPIYWPDRQAGSPDRYERAWQSIQRTDGGAQHPADDLRAIFGNADRVAGYQYRMRDCVNAIRSKPEAGAQVSYSGGLIENITSLGAAGQLGYTSSWYNSIREARGWSTSGGKPRMDVVVFPFHHPLLPLCDENTIRREIQLYKQIYADAWNATPAMSKGFFPSEMAFSARLIKPLVQEGVQWAVVSNEHLGRACTNFPLVLGSGGVNCDPPNKADQRNAAQSNWLRTSISRGCSPVAPYPFGFQPHYARYLDPATGGEYKLIVIPADQALSWQDGYAPIGLSSFDALQTQNSDARPQLVLMTHDGDNAWGGGYSYYMEAVPNFVNNATTAGYVATTVEQYLANHAVPTNDIVHVEDGAWVNADGDFGSPSFLNWNWPLLSAAGQIDIAAGWHVDERNWAVITAAQNRVDTAEQIAGSVNLAKVLYPDASTTPAEHAWHYFLAGLNSGFMYYGTPLDHEVKATIACNLAIGYADSVIGGGSQDTTPPTIWAPQRHPWNPGSLNFGPQYGYQQYQSNGDFWVWTFAYDVSGVASVALKYRTDADGVLADANETYAGGAGVGAWQSLPMTSRTFPAGNVYNDGSINFYTMPTYIADEYYVQVTGVRSAMLDYYVEATDTRGAVRKSPIHHVYVGDGAGGGGGDPRVTWTPDPAHAGQPVLISYDAGGGPIASATTVKAHVGFDNWATVVSPDYTMTKNTSNNRWEVSVPVAASATQVDVAFNDGAGHWDNNTGQDWHVTATGAQTGWTMDGVRDADARLVAQNGSLSLYAGMKGAELYVAAPDAGEGNDHFIFMALSPGSLRSAPWAKTGLVANWSAFLADENDNAYSAWYDAGAGVTVRSATGANGGVLEGTINLKQKFGHVPTAVWLAFAPYASGDGGALVASSQIPLSVNGNGNVDAGEYVKFDIFGPGDTNCDGTINLFDIQAFMTALTDPAGYGNSYPNCTINTADANGDGTVNLFDIQAFVDLLGG